MYSNWPSLPKMVLLSASVVFIAAYWSISPAPIESQSFTRYETLGMTSRVMRALSCT